MRPVPATRNIFVPLAVAGIVATTFLAWAADEKKQPASPAVAQEKPKQAMKDLTGLPESELKKHLTPEQFNVCKGNGTERPFQNAYWNNKEPGLYVDVISGEPLFASTTKFESGSGWPSFFQPVEPGNIVEKKDVSHGMVRTEVRSKKGDAHLGHLFDDGRDVETGERTPNGMRYCINSAALRFIPVAKLKEEGYEKYLHLFEKGAATAKK